MRPALQTRRLTGLLAGACLIAAALSLRDAPGPRPPAPPDWLQRYERLRAALPASGDVTYLADPAADPTDRTGYFRAQYVATPTVLHFETVPEGLFRSRRRMRPVLIDFVAPPDERVATTIGRVRRAARLRGVETRLVKLGDSLFLVVEA